ncbi:MAG: hypothetical protein Pg6C_07190 [Treponemataceae bacterium]|nr:MAG: hypothetical protein Pg6C_07190 [Treponemataceae bacterium]
MSAQNPVAFFLLLLLIPALIISAARFRAIARHFPLGARLIIAWTLRVFAFVFLVCALADVSWGERPVFSARSGQAVSFVFDISYSMTAEDAMESPASLSRLDAARVFARGILRKLNADTPISVVIAKGGGTAVIPLTNDRAQIESFLDALSPDLMSAPGSSIGKGIAAACLTFPSDFAYKPAIVVFTDGDETDDAMRSAIFDAVRTGVSVYVAGFGAEEEIEITAGDGVTRVKTALRKDAIIRAVDDANSLPAKNYSGIHAVEARFFGASERGSAQRLLDALYKNAEDMMMAEIQRIPRRALFTALAIVFFCAGLAYEQLNAQKMPRIIRRFFSGALVSLLILGFVSCSSSWAGTMKIFSGAIHWRGGRYQKAELSFLSAYETAQKYRRAALAEYALFGIASAQLAQGNDAVAAEKFLALAESAPDKVKFAALYNSGIIASNDGDYDRAAEFFKKALLVNSASIDAKLNLEIAQSLYEEEARKARQDVIPASNKNENISEAARQIFSYLYKIDEGQWKANQDGYPEDPQVIDY